MGLRPRLGLCQFRDGLCLWNPFNCHRDLGVPVTHKPTELRAALLEEAQARFRLRRLEAELKPDRPDPETLRAYAAENGPGFTLAVYDKAGGRPFALATVKDGRTTYNTDDLIRDLAEAHVTTVESIKAVYGKPGQPYWEFKEI